MSPKTAKKKIDTAVLVAIIGLAGTIIAALLGSPVLIALIEKNNATATSAIDSVAGGEPIFSQDFEAGNSSGFAFISGTWEVVEDQADPGNTVLQATAPDVAEPTTKTFFGPNKFTNGIVEFRCKFLHLGDLYVDFRYQDGGTYVLYFSAQKQYVALASNVFIGSDWQYSELSPESLQPFSIQKDTWYSVRLQVNEQQFSVRIDGNRLISASDARLDSGRLRFVLGSNAVLYLDDIQVWDSK